MSAGKGREKRGVRMDRGGGRGRERRREWRAGGERWEDREDRRIPSEGVGSEAAIVWSRVVDGTYSVEDMT